jgi:hypothetical protein
MLQFSVLLGFHLLSGSACAWRLVQLLVDSINGRYSCDFAHSRSQESTLIFSYGTKPVV